MIKQNPMPTCELQLRSTGFIRSKHEPLRLHPEVRVYLRHFFALFIGVTLLMSPAAAQQSNQTPHSEDQENSAKDKKKPSRPATLGRLPIEWVIGPYIPAQGVLHSLTNSQRREIYLRQTFLTAGSYVARAFSAGIDQARGEPHDWGGGLAGYGRRYAARYGE